MTTQLDTREALFEVMAQIIAEREAAKPLVEELLSREELPWDEEIPEEWRTAGFVEELTKRAAGITEADPQKSISFLQLSLAIATSVSEGTYPSIVHARIVGQTWKEIAWAHRYEGAFEEALRALKAANAALTLESALMHDVTIVKFSLGGVLSQMRRLDEGWGLISEAQTEYGVFDDKRRMLRCEIVKGAILTWRGELEAACEKFRQIADAVTEVDDLHTQGVIHNNLGHVLVKLGRVGEARAALDRARQIYVELDMAVEIDRVDWGFALVMLLEGEFDKALTLLRRLRAAFLGREMVDDAGLIGLDIVDALVALDQRDEARLLTEEVLEEFRHSNLNSRAITALAYLRELLPTSAKARAAVKHVRSHVEASLHKPDELFVPLPEEK